MHCGRCERDLEDRSTRSEHGGQDAKGPSGGAGAYRSANYELGCAPCAVRVFHLDELAARAGTLAFRLLESPLVRTQRTLHFRCPACETRLVRVVLGWDALAPSTLETCPYCRLVVVDDHELDATVALFRGAEPMHRAEAEDRTQGAGCGGSGEPSYWRHHGVSAL